MMRLLLAVCAALGACAVPVPLTPAWTEANPLSWDVDAVTGTLTSCGLPDLAIADGPSATSIRLTARVTPTEARGESAYATFGVAVADDAQNYWALQFVKLPDVKGGAHTMELGQRRLDQWPANVFDKLGGLRKLHRPWQFGHSYTVALELNAHFVRGEVRDAEGRLVYDAKTSFAKRPAVTCGRPAVIQRGQFRGQIAQLDAVASGFKPVPPPVTFPAYASDDFVADVSGRATGFFHVEKKADGRWWTIDPLGRGIVVKGCDGLSYLGPYCEALGRFPYGSYNAKAYASPEAWADATVSRLKAWGFNMLGNSGETRLMRRGLAHAISLRLGDGLCHDFDDDTLWIGPNLHVPRTAFPNVFHPKFADYCRHVAEQRCAPNRNDPWLLGYFLDNELAWNGWWSTDYRGSASASTHVHGNGTARGGLFNAVMAKRPGHTAKQALVAFLKGRVMGDLAAFNRFWKTSFKTWDEVAAATVLGATRLQKDAPAHAAMKEAFLELVAERYFGTIANAIRAADPNHMILGARFDGLRQKGGKVLPVVWRAAGRHCDVLSFNCYPWANLDTDVVYLSHRPNEERAVEVFRFFHEVCGRPFFITEWSFPALDSGLPCRGGAGQRVKTQNERVQASELWLKTVLAEPYMLGTDFFKWVDQPALGVSRAFPEDSNYGLVTIEDRPYENIVSMFTRLNSQAGALRCAAPPPERVARPWPLAQADVARTWFRTTADASTKNARVEFVRDGESYRVEAGRFVCEGRLGGKDIFSRVTLEGHEIGSLGGVVLLSLPSGSRIWPKLTGVKSVDWDPTTETLTVQADGGEGRVTFAQTFRLTFAVSVPGFFCELVNLTNTGKSPFRLESVSARALAPYAFDSVAKPASGRPCWRGEPKAAWVAPDGRWWGATTTSEAVRRFDFHVTGKGEKRMQHPDAMFCTEGDLNPGATLDFKGQTHLVFHAGLAGSAAFLGN